MNCPYCNERISDNENYCHNCGYKLDLIKNRSWYEEHKQKFVFQRDLIETELAMDKRIRRISIVITILAAATLINSILLAIVLSK